MATAKVTEKEAACVTALKGEYPASKADPADAGFLSDSTYLRFARARDGNVERASELLGATLKWRQQTKPYAITMEEVKNAMKQTTMYCGGRCNIGCPVIAMALGMQNDCTVEERTKQLVYIMEETQRKGYERITWIIDFGAMGNHRDERSKEARKETMKILQDYYPERMARILLYRTPWYIRMLLGVAKMFMDARTAAKVYNAGRTIEELEKFIDRDQVPPVCGGTMKGSALSHLEELPSLNSEEAQRPGHKQHTADADSANDGGLVTSNNTAGEEPAAANGEAKRNDNIAATDAA
ncbi:conserved hypothetical protein [Leishmania infantum JPCM5]|uniref:CRAL/TRIO_-_N-terminal_domain/CRAL /TRIO_domain_containing_protein_-_putative n=2 Tax=Leishmania infantum TaxID=5671 RepID=A0A6L0XVX5_LEIIN|nr:conserved hypothetical protein [Leishmania infantum JPCM5]CAC9513666.1 CRAL/TRIO_-_N-terminal_domain/CRAL /TRIO_domain_containing_protein_-_putative [Leishmania infantum]CAM70065.1 conserved hypothetical protein [Leishmania infantum JPCM5]SUZ43983.1 CRAL/TRIO_-_N-terminal_domain/CRAL /TRIO_domain_containing_protein_-_putative [Leishmania infantum]|eukprot:XP_001467014.1 conserved hypothetical protein [Leishmania infantum JPCM5]